MIISASRRTDIPAFFADDFMQWIRQGFCPVSNPYSGKKSNVSLLPGDVECIVFWTKNPAPLMPYLPELSGKGYQFYFQFTLNPYGAAIERNLPPKETLCRTFRELARKIGRKKVIWRYDPIIFTQDDSLNQAWHIRQFSRLAQEFAPYTEQCIISFMDFYGKCLKRKKCQAWREPAPEEMYALAENLAGIAKQNGLAINACAEKMDLSAAGIGSAHCIDAALIGRITGKKIFSGKDKHQRPECGCAVSRDIGTYGTCRHDCVYCYAN